MSDVRDFDVTRQVVLTDKSEVPFDYLILACGASHSYFGHDEWEPHAPGLKTIEQATEIRRRILTSFEEAERENNPLRQRALLTFAVIGAGPTGVEMAGAISEIARHTLRHDFRRIDPADARVTLIEAGSRVLSSFPDDLSQRAAEALHRLEVELLLDTLVTHVASDHLILKSAEQSEKLETRTVIWAAGVAASSLVGKLAGETGATVDKSGRIQVDERLNVPGNGNVFVIGDAACCLDRSGEPLPGMAPVAMQQGQYAARAIRARMRSRPVDEPFVYRNRGSMAVIGRYHAIAVIGKRHLSGFPAWLVWGLIHLREITQFQNRLMVMMQWAWTFFSRRRCARLITGEDSRKIPLDSSGENA